MSERERWCFVLQMCFRDVDMRCDVMGGTEGEICL